jgi:hypothetical protein
MTSLIEQQMLVRKRFSADFMRCEKASKAGIALQSMGHSPLNALRLKPEGDTCGWYIWAGEYSDSPNFFQPLHVEHLSKYVPNLLPYLGLGAGWRVLLASDNEDVWYDKDLLKTKNNSHRTKD